MRISGKILLITLLVAVLLVPIACASGKKPSDQPQNGKSMQRPLEGDEVYIGDTATRLYHSPDCPQLKKIDADDTVRFHSARGAENFGYTPHHDCVPER